MGRAGDERLTPDDPVAAVRTALRSLPFEAGVVLAVSGGPDSVGMAYLVTAARPDLRATVVHVRHGLRDDAADADIAAAHASALRLPLRVVPVTVAQGAGPEDAARRARLRALGDVAVAVSAAYVLTGHTADDQAETVLLNIARGAGLPGLAGMPAQRPLDGGVTLVHPVLAVRRAAVRAVAEESGLPLAVDPTNTDAAQRRARARAALLPALSSLTGAQTDPVVALARLAGHARRDTQALDALAAAAFDAAVARWGPVLVLPCASVAELAEAVARRVIRLLLQRAGGGAHPPPSAAVDAVLSLGDGAQLTLPGGALVSRGGGRLAAVAADRAVLDEQRGPAPLDLPELGVTVRSGPEASAEVAAAVLPPWAPSGAATSAAVPRGAVLQVRPRRRGDRIRTAAGTQRVAAAMVDAGVPRVARELVPVICDGQGLLWVPGVAVRADAQGPDRVCLSPRQPK